MTQSTKRQNRFVRMLKAIPYRIWHGAAWFLIGTLAGSIVSLARIGKEWDRVKLDNAALIDEVERLAGELSSRERALTRDRVMTVRSVEIEITGNIRPQTRLVIESEVRDMLHHLLGEDVDSLQPAYIEKSLTKTIQIGQEDVSIIPRHLRLGSTILVRLHASESGPELTL